MSTFIFELSEHVTVPATKMEGIVIGRGEYDPIHCPDNENRYLVVYDNEAKDTTWHLESDLAHGVK